MADERYLDTGRIRELPGHPSRSAGGGIWSIAQRVALGLGLAGLVVIGVKVFDLARPSAGSLSVTGGGISIVDGTVGARSVDGTDFGTVLIGSRAEERVFVLRNEGEQELTLGTVELPAGFTLVEGPEPSVLPPGLAIALVVHFDATDLGAATGAIRIPVAERPMPFSFVVSGRVVGPPALVVVAQGGGLGFAMRDGEPAVAAFGTDFGAVPFGSVATLEFQVRNEGGAPLMLGDVFVPAGFVLAEGLVPELAPGEADIFSIRLDAGTLGRRSGEVSFATGSEPGRFAFSITGEVTMELAESVIPLGEANAAEFSADGSRLLLLSRGAAGIPPRMRVLDTATGAVLLDDVAGDRQVLSPDGGRLAYAYYGRENAIGVSVIDIATGEYASLYGGGWDLPVMAFSPDGDRIATADRGIVTVWDAATGEPKATLAGHEGTVTAIEFSPDGSRIVTGSTDGSARIWDATNGQELLALRPIGDVIDLKYSPGGTRIVATTVSSTRLWDTASGADMAPFSIASGTFAFSFDGSRLYTAGETVPWTFGNINALLMPEVAPIYTLDPQPLAVWSAFSGAFVSALRIDVVPHTILVAPSDRWLVTHTADGAARLWDTMTGDPVRDFAASSVMAIAMTGDASRILAVMMPTGDETELTLRIWERPTIGVDGAPSPSDWDARLEAWRAACAPGSEWLVDGKRHLCRPI